VKVIATGDDQAAEQKFEVSRRILEVCLERGFPVSVLERSPLDVRDLDLIKDINERAPSVVFWSQLPKLRYDFSFTLADIASTRSVEPERLFGLRDLHCRQIVMFDKMAGECYNLGRGHPIPQPDSRYPTRRLSSPSLYQPDRWVAPQLREMRHCA